MADDFAAFGAPQELIEMHTASDALEIWPENVETVTAFLRLQTQWIVGAMGGLVGLNYQAVEALFNIIETTDRVKVFDGLQVMERAALQIINGRKG